MADPVIQARRRIEDGTGESARRVADAPGEERRYYGVVYNGGHMPTAGPAVVLTHPARPAVTGLAEGEGASSPADESASVPAIVLGGGISAGMLLRCRRIDGWWVAEKGPANNCGQLCVRAVCGGGTGAAPPPPAAGCLAPQPLLGDPGGYLGGTEGYIGVSEATVKVYAGTDTTVDPVATATTPKWSGPQWLYGSYGNPYGSYPRPVNPACLALPPGSYTVVVTKPGYRDFTKAVTIRCGNPQAVAALMVPTSYTAGVLVFGCSADGPSPAGATCGIAGATVSYSDGTTTVSGVTGADGTVPFPGLPWPPDSCADWTVTVTPPTPTCGYGPATVHAADQPQTIRPTIAAACGSLWIVVTLPPDGTHTCVTPYHFGKAAWPQEVPFSCRFGTATLANPTGGFRGGPPAAGDPVSWPCLISAAQCGAITYTGCFRALTPGVDLADCTDPYLPTVRGYRAATVVPVFLVDFSFVLAPGCSDTVVGWICRIRSYKAMTCMHRVWHTDPATGLSWMTTEYEPPVWGLIDKYVTIATPGNVPTVGTMSCGPSGTEVAFSLPTGSLPSFQAVSATGWGNATGGVCDPMVITGNVTTRGPYGDPLIPDLLGTWFTVSKP